MGLIHVLDPITIDKIAAGEVIERPASVVKELVENAIDAEATAISVEIEEGGISLIRVTDDGKGMEKEDIESAFLRHSTSKIKKVDDLLTISSLGFRGEALSSIASVSKVEMITKTVKEESGYRYEVEGGANKSMSPCGAPEGTSFMIRQLFYNTPARRKFLKTPSTEASHISDLLMRLALCRPDISFQFISNGNKRLHTSGRGEMKDVIYHVYGREITSHLLPVSFEEAGYKIEGYIGEPVISRGNRNYETFFINGRYIKDSLISRAVEDAYKDFSMQHRFPFAVLKIQVPQEQVDVNVHPTKMEIRFANQQKLYSFLFSTLVKTLHEKEHIPALLFDNAKQPLTKEEKKKETELIQEPKKEEGLPYFMEEMKKRVTQRHADAIKEHKKQESTKDKQEEQTHRIISYHEQHSQAEVTSTSPLTRPFQMDKVKEAVTYRKEQSPYLEQLKATQDKAIAKALKEEENQLSMFDEGLLKQPTLPKITIVGQVFDTYWIVQWKETMYIIDQHAAHERVLYEKIVANVQNKAPLIQYISPPLILNLTMGEAELLKTYKEHFTNMGFEIEPFGGDSFAVRGVPADLFSIGKKELLIEMIDQLSEEISPMLAPDRIDQKMATMACKAAVKGNQHLSIPEVQRLLEELLSLENPYHCPHGRPTIVAMTKTELEKKFKRIV